MVIGKERKAEQIKEPQGAQTQKKEKRPAVLTDREEIKRRLKKNTWPTNKRKEEKKAAKERDSKTGNVGAARSKKRRDSGRAEQQTAAEPWKK